MIFAKEPVPGTVKTRLIPALGEVGAARLYEKLLYRTLGMACKLMNVKVILVADLVDGNVDYWLKLAKDFGFEFMTQCTGHLGERMNSALEEALKYSSQVVIIGSDCPEYSTAYLQSAFNALDSHDVVLGPASDGGYVLIGAKLADSKMFQNIPWSTDRVYDATCKLLDEMGRSRFELVTLNDVDEPVDLVHVQHLLNNRRNTSSEMA